MVAPRQAPIPHLASIQVQSAWVHTDPHHLRLAAIGIYTDDTRQTLTSGVAWRSSEPNMAAVSDAGVVTFVPDGTRDRHRHIPGQKRFGERERSAGHLKD